ncbi:MAG: DUF5675 family protein [Bacteroidota bacterium]
MKACVLKLVRDTYTLKSTVGKLYVNDVFFCHTLEDVVRGEGIKIKAHTAIPSGVYKVDLSISHRFKRIMPMIYTEDNRYEIKLGGIGFKGVRFHGGNTHKNTEGCPLVAYNRLSDDLIQGTAEKELTAKLKEFNEIRLIVTNTPQES